jgi:LPXTG-motif cell wall-anchored protein
MPGESAPSLDFASSSAAQGGKTGPQTQLGSFIGSPINIMGNSEGGGVSPLLLGGLLALGGWWLWRRTKRKK